MKRIDLAKGAGKLGPRVRIRASPRPIQRNEPRQNPALEGRTRLAQRFSAGESGNIDSSPGGTARFLHTLDGTGQSKFGSLRGGRVLRLMLGVVLLLAASCKRPPQTEQFFPASNQVAGWARSGEIRTFEAADLWKYIDGDVERYLKAGVQRMCTADYKFQDKADAVVDIYIMGNAEGAEKIFNAEPAADGKPVQLGDGARLHGQSLVFRKGAYLVRIVAYEESAETQQALLQLGHGIEQRLAR